MACQSLFAADRQPPCAPQVFCSSRPRREPDASMAALEADGCDTPLAAMCSLGEQGARENVNVPEGPSTTAEENGFSLARCQLQNTTLNDLPGVIRITQQDVADALAEIEMKKQVGNQRPDKRRMTSSFLSEVVKVPQRRSAPRFARLVLGAQLAVPAKSRLNAR